MRSIRFAVFIFSIAIFFILTGCAGSAYLASSGPTRKQVASATQQGIHVINLTPAIAKREKAFSPCFCFGKDFHANVPTYAIGLGDTVSIQIWEAPPATLFISGSSNISLASDSTSSNSGQVVIPNQMVDNDGKITVPYIGRISVVGKRTSQVEAEIRNALKKKAHNPQVIVRIAEGPSFTVTVVGEVERSLAMPLTARGEHLLDAIAATGGVKGPSNKIAIRVARGNKEQTVPLDAIIADPKQNIVLEPGDIITALFQPNAFVAMGAITKPGEIPFEATGISLSQALARVGGLVDNRSDITGVFLFREDDRVMKAMRGKQIPVIYQVDLRNPAEMLAMRDFPVEDNDVIYVSNAPASDLQKFMTVIGSVVYPIISVYQFTN